MVSEARRGRTQFLTVPAHPNPGFQGQATESPQILMVDETSPALRCVLNLKRPRQFCTILKFCLHCSPNEFTFPRGQAEEQEDSSEQLRGVEINPQARLTVIPEQSNHSRANDKRGGLPSRNPPSRSGVPPHAFTSGTSNRLAKAGKDDSEHDALQESRKSISWEDEGSASCISEPRQANLLSGSIPQNAY